jgi:arylsulfatase A-like enzyme
LNRFVYVFLAWLMIQQAVIAQVGGKPSDSFIQPKKQPNVLIVLADDLGYSDLSCYGGEIATPALDQLAKKGIRYSDFYTSARGCPSRASLLTGLYPHQAGVGSLATLRPDDERGSAYLGHLNDSCVTLAEILLAQGYSTWMVGKWHLGIPGPIGRGFQNYFGFKNFLAYAEDQWSPDSYVRLPVQRPEIDYSDTTFYATDVFVDYAVEFIQQAQQQPEKPWFLYLAHSSPHFPIQAPKEDIDRFVTIYRKGWDVLREARLERMKKLGFVPNNASLPPREIVPIDATAIANGYPGQPNPAWNDLPEERREDLARRMATYAAMVKHIDQGMARLVTAIDKTHELDNTLILFLSDNGACYEWGPFGFDGESRRGFTKMLQGDELKQMGQAGTASAYGSAWANLSNTPLRLYKHFCHEGGLRSPLIVHWPKGIAKPGSIIQEPTHLMDIFPTVLDLAKITYPREHAGRQLRPLEGTSLIPSLQGQALPPRDLAFEHQEARAVRRGPHKLVWGKRMLETARWELYHLTDDPFERHDLAAEKPQLVDELSLAWLEWAERVQVHPFYRH